MKKYLWRVLIWLDQGGNVILMGGRPGESISSRCGKIILAAKKMPVFGKYKKPKFCVFCTALCFFLRRIDENHCIKNIKYEESYEQMKRWPISQRRRTEVYFAIQGEIKKLKGHSHAENVKLNKLKKDIWKSVCSALGIPE